MNLREIESVLKKVPLEKALLTQDGHVLGNLQAFKSVASALREIPQFKPNVDELERSDLYSTGADRVGVTPQTVTDLKQKADALVLGAMGLRDALSKVLAPVAPETILVKLPQDQHLSEVVDVLEDLQKALGQLVSLEGIDGEVEISSWESGSLWVFLYLKSVAAVDLAGRALRSAAIAYQAIQKGRILGQHVNLLKVKVTSARDIQQAQEELLKQLVEEQARTLETETFSSHEPERFERLKTSIRLLAELLDRGTTVYPALEMPKSASEHFPDLERINTVLSEMKQLEDSPSTAAELAVEGEPSSEPPGS